MKIRLDLVAVVAVVAALAFVAIAFAVSASRGTPDYTSVYSTAETTPAPQPAQPVTKYQLPADPRLLVIGDSWTWGQGVTPNTQGYAYQAAKLMGWPVEVNGGRGTGYITDAKDRTIENPDRFPMRVAAMPGSLEVQNPNIILVQGSINDTGNPDAVIHAAADTIADLKKKFPEARIIVLGPIFSPSVVSGSSRAARAESDLAGVAMTEQVVFLNPLEGTRFIPDDQWTSAMGPDNHPNASGHQLIATQLAERLRGVFA